MTIPRLVGIGDELAATLPDLGKQIALAINPHYQDDNRLRAALAADPTLLQRVADLNIQNPGYLEKLGMKQSSKMVGGVGQSFEGQMEEQLRAAFTQLTPEAREEFVSGKLGTKTGAERQLQGQQIQQGAQRIEAGARENRVGAAQEPAQIAGAQSQLNDIQRRMQMETLRPGINQKVAKFKGNVFSAVRNNAGGFTPEEQDAIMQLPEYQDRYKMDQQNYWNQVDADYRERSLKQDDRQHQDRMNKPSGRITIDDYMERQRIELAAHVAQSRGGVDPKRMLDFMNNEGDLAGKPEYAKEQAAWESYKNSIGVRERTVAGGRLAKEVLPRIAVLNNPRNPNRRGMSEEEINGQIQQANLLAAEIYGPLGIQPPKWTYKKTEDGWFKDKVVVLESAPVELIPQLGQPQGVEAENEAAVATWRNLYQTDRNGFEAELRKKPAPEQAAIKQSLGIR